MPFVDKRAKCQSAWISYTTLRVLRFHKRPSSELPDIGYPTASGRIEWLADQVVILMGWEISVDLMSEAIAHTYLAPVSILEFDLVNQSIAEREGVAVPCRRQS